MKAPNVTKKSFDFSKLTKFLYRYHMLLYLIFISVGLGVGLLLILNVLGTQGEASLNDQSVTQFDENTINQLRDDAQKSETNSFSFPSGRIDPFSD